MTSSSGFNTQSPRALVGELGPETLRPVSSSVGPQTMDAVVEKHWIGGFVTSCPWCHLVYCGLDAVTAIRRISDHWRRDHEPELGHRLHVRISQTDVRSEGAAAVNSGTNDKAPAVRVNAVPGHEPVSEARK